MTGKIRKQKPESTDVPRRSGEGVRYGELRLRSRTTEREIDREVVKEFKDFKSVWERLRAKAPIGEDVVIDFIPSPSTINKLPKTEMERRIVATEIGKYTTEHDEFPGFTCILAGRRDIANTYLRFYLATFSVLIWRNPDCRRVVLRSQIVAYRKNEFKAPSPAAKINLRVIRFTDPN